MKNNEHSISLFFKEKRYIHICMYMCDVYVCVYMYTCVFIGYYDAWKTPNRPR